MGNWVKIFPYIFMFPLAQIFVKAVKMTPVQKFLCCTVHVLNRERRPAYQVLCSENTVLLVAFDFEFIKYMKYWQAPHKTSEPWNLLNKAKSTRNSLILVLTYVLQQLNNYRLLKDRRNGMEAMGSRLKRAKHLWRGQNKCRIWHIGVCWSSKASVCLSVCVEQVVIKMFICFGVFILMRDRHFALIFDRNCTH